MKKKPAMEKFLIRVRYRPDGCWGWAGVTHNVYGYSLFHPKRGHIERAHRWAYQQFRGCTKSDLVLDHLCKNVWCVNPMHLEEVPQRVNVRRGKICRLKPDDVHSIRLASAVGIHAKEIASRFGVSYHTVHDIVSWKKWKTDLAT